jgi:hypothetical protein
MSTIENEHVEIADVDSVEILSLVDNSIDFLSTTNEKEVKPLGNGKKTNYDKLAC